MTALNLNDPDLIATSEKEQDRIVGDRIATTSNKATPSLASEELDSNSEQQFLSPAEAERAEQRRAQKAKMREGMHQRHGVYPMMDRQRVCNSPTIAISTYVF